MSGFYERVLLPRMIDRVCGMGRIMAQRAKLVPQARGRVLELGIGTGLNLQFYDAERVDSIFAVDPAAEMHRFAQRRAARIDIPVESVPLVIEQIDAPSASFDTVVTTFTLCTIPDAVAALREARRVLKPGGRVLFCEHGVAPDASVRRWQDRLTPWWKPLAGGCHLNRDIPQLLRDAGLRVTQLDTGYLPGPRPFTYVYTGHAEI